ncbi:MAG: HNH endonuclease [Candidatus Omnitrophica bacterium]|nr:HNH endonuclease [Candidatus Omnitrophota bacterium]
MRIVSCNICNKEVKRSERDYRRNKSKIFYCSVNCRNIGYKGNGNPNFNNKWSEELKQNQSKTLIDQFKNGREVWNKGKDKTIDPRLAKCGVIGNDFGKYSKGSKRPDNIIRNKLLAPSKRYGLQQIHKYKYHGKNWRIIRKQVLERDNYTCQRCKDTPKLLIAHHKKPYRLGGSDLLDNLITLCKICHCKEEKISRELYWSKPK